MFCSKCGEPKREGADFCTNCGNQFSKESIDEIKDDYQLNVGVATIIGLGSGIITGIFSAALTQTYHFDWWGWAIILVATTIFIAILIFNGFSAIKQSLNRKLKRK